MSFSTKSMLFHWLTRASLLSEVKDTIIQNGRSFQPYELIPCSGRIKNHFYLDGKMACLARLTHGLPLSKRGFSGV